MLYFDFTWDIDSTGILFDKELGIEQLGWDDGDVFKLVKDNGRIKLVKVQPLEKFKREKYE